MPLFIDVTKPLNTWALPEDFAPNEVDVVYNANMIHISSNAAVAGLFQVINIFPAFFTFPNENNNLLS